VLFWVVFALLMLLMLGCGFAAMYCFCCHAGTEGSTAKRSAGMHVCLEKVPIYATAVTYPSASTPPQVNIFVSFPGNGTSTERKLTDETCSISGSEDDCETEGDAPLKASVAAMERTLSSNSAVSVSEKSSHGDCDTNLSPSFLGGSQNGSVMSTPPPVPEEDWSSEYDCVQGYEQDVDVCVTSTVVHFELSAKQEPEYCETACCENFSISEPESAFESDSHVDNISQQCSPNSHGADMEQHEEEYWQLELDLELELLQRGCCTRKIAQICPSESDMENTDSQNRDWSAGLISLALIGTDEKSCKRQRIV